VSRFRSPSGRHAHRRPDENAVALPGARAVRPRPMGAPPMVPAIPRASAEPGRPAVARPAVRHRTTAPSAIRNGMTAAAVAGGALTVVMPTVVLTSGPAGAANAMELPAPVLAMVVDDTGPSPVASPPTSLQPVAAPEAELPPAVEVAGLLKAAGLAEVADKAAARAEAARCDADLDGLGRVKSWAREAARFLSCLYDEPDLGGVAQRAGASDHPTGLAVDLMVRGDRGDRIAACALANKEELGISYVLWKQRSNYGDGWERMSDRGGDTANHRDHVHISFDRSKPDGSPSVERCL